MTLKSNNVCIHKSNNLVNKYNNTYHRTTKMKPVDVKSSMYMNFDKENNYESPKFKVGDNVRISRYKNIFTKDYVPNCSETVFVITKIKKTVSQTHVISDLNREEIV